MNRPWPRTIKQKPPGRSKTNWCKLNCISSSVTMYARFLGNSFNAPATLKNYLSGAKLWVEHHLGDARAFLAHPQADVLKRPPFSLNHVVNRAYPLNTSELQVISSYFDSSSDVPPAFKACVLLAYPPSCEVPTSLPQLCRSGEAHIL